MAMFIRILKQSADLQFDSLSLFIAQKIANKPAQDASSQWRSTLQSRWNHGS